MDKRDTHTYPCGIYCSSHEIQGCHEHHPIETHAPILCRPAMTNEPVIHKYHSRETKSCVHGCTVGAPGRVAEPGMQGRNNAQRSKHRNIEPVELLQRRVAEEAIVHARNGGSPHQEDDAEIVELIAEFLHVRAVVADDVITAACF